MSYPKHGFHLYYLLLGIKRNKVLKKWLRIVLTHKFQPSSNGFLEYIILSASIQMFSIKPMVLPIMMTLSALPSPYMAHRKRPTINTARKRIETSSVSLVFNAFLIWGKVLATENPVAESYES